METLVISSTGLDSCSAGTNPYRIVPLPALTCITYEYGKTAVTTALTAPYSTLGLCGSESITTTISDDVSSTLYYLTTASSTELTVFVDNDTSLIGQTRIITYKYVIDQNGYYKELTLFEIIFVENNENAPAFSDAMETELVII